jgi:hsp70-interacting protein
MEIICEKKELYEKLAAFDELELLVESSDNACGTFLNIEIDLEPLGLWPSLLHLLEQDPEAELRKYAAWTMGTAVQNNLKSQQAVIHSL